MYIQPNKMLSNSSRVIRPFKCSFLATEGPNILGKIDLANINILYESQATARMILNPQSVNQPILYGSLGNNVTFILLKITYDETDPKCQIEEEQYISYWMEGEPNIIRYAHKLLLLTGNSTNRVPQIYLNNPSDYTIYIDVLMANLTQSDISFEDVTNEIVNITGLYFSNVISDTFWNTGESISGSTMFTITDITDEIQVSIPYTDILTYTLDTTNFDILITTTGKTITLDFLSEFEMYQAHSRILWVQDNPTIRYLTSTEPTLDLIPPVFTMNSGATPTTPSGSTYVFPVTRDGSGNVNISSSTVLYWFISGITDNRDGILAISDATIQIRESGLVLPLTEIIETGTYDIIVYISDNATNKTLENYIILVDDIGPIITFTSKGSGVTFDMTIPDDTQIPASGITIDDIIRETIDSVYDAVDGTIPNSSVSIIISGDTGITYVFEPGQYSINYSVTDASNNTTTYDKTMVVTGSIVINSGETYTLGMAITGTSFIFNAPNTGDTATIIISGETNVIASNSGGSFVWDLGGLYEYTFTTETESTSVTIQGSDYTITYDGSGVDTLLFTIDKLT